MIKFFQLIICAVTFSSVTAQNLISYQGAFGAVPSDFIINTPDDGYILFSTVDAAYDLGVVTAPVYGTRFIVAIKFDNNHQEVWQQSYGGDGFDGVLKVIEMEDGFLIGANSNSPVSGNKTAPAIGLLHIWLIKIDFDGNIVDQFSFGGSQTESLTDLIELADGNFFLLARSNSPASGDKSEDAYGGTDYWGVKVAPQGTVLWEKTYGTEDGDTPKSVVQLANGNLILAGHTSAGISGLKTEESYGVSDFWVLCVNQQTGALLWDRTYGGEHPDDLSCAVASGDYFYIAGRSYSGISGLRTLERKGTFDTWFLKIDASGSIVSEKCFGGDANDGLSDIQVDDDRLLLFFSSSSGISGDKIEASRGGLDYWLVITNLYGDIERQKTIGGSETEFARGILLRPNNNIMLYGLSRSSISGERTVAQLSVPPIDLDTWIVELDAVTLSIKSGGELSYKAFPNPFTDNVTVALPEGIDIAQVHIHDVSGKRLQTMSSPQIENNQIVLDLAYLQPGVYFIHVHHGATSGVLRLVKE